jgi:Tol biopolymer transport system component
MLTFLTACSASPQPSVPTQAEMLAVLPSATSAPPTPTAELPAPQIATDAPTTASAATPEPQARLVQLLEGECCTQPGWSPDGSRVWYVDANGAGASALWAVDPARPFAPELVRSRLGLLSPDGSLLAYPRAGVTVIERLADGTIWTAPSQGRAISFSPDSTRILWTVATATQNFDRRAVQVWIANVDGSDARAVAQLTGGGAGWMPDSRRLLITNRDLADQPPILAVYDPADGATAALERSEFIRSTALSPNGAWLAYTLQFTGDPARDGLWVRRLDDLTQPARRIDAYGAYRWRPDNTLLLIPLEPVAGGHRVLAVAPTDGTVRDLIDPAQVPFRILGGDFSLSPDGRRLAFVNAADRNLWLLELP